MFNWILDPERPLFLCVWGSHVLWGSQSPSRVWLEQRFSFLLRRVRMRGWKEALDSRFSLTLIIDHLTQTPDHLFFWFALISTYVLHLLSQIQGLTWAEHLLYLHLHEASPRFGDTTRDNLFMETRCPKMHFENDIFSAWLIKTHGCGVLSCCRTSDRTSSTLNVTFRLILAANHSCDGRCRAADHPDAL